MKKIIESKKPIVAYFLGPTGSGRFKFLINFVQKMYQPGSSELSQLQHILSDYPQIVWFSGSRIIADQNKKNIYKESPELDKYSHFEVYTLTKLENCLNNYKNLIVIMDESCIQSQKDVIAGRAKEIRTIIQLVNQAKVSLMIEGSHLSEAIKYYAQIGFSWENNEFVVKKNHFNFND